MWYNNNDFKPVLEKQTALIRGSLQFEEERFFDSDGFPFPIKVSMSSPNGDAFEDDNIITELLTQVFQFSGQYWKSLKPQNVPITIRYAEMVTQLVPRFQKDIKEEAKSKLWFL
jgi:hypothetical protein